MDSDRELINLVMEVTLARNSGVFVFGPLLDYYDDLSTAAYLSFFLANQLDRRKNSNDPESLEFRYFKLPRLTIRAEVKLSDEQQCHIHRRLVEEGIIQERKIKFDGYKWYLLDLYKIAKIFASNWKYPSKPKPERNIFNPSLEPNSNTILPKENTHTHISTDTEEVCSCAHTHISREIRVVREEKMIDKKESSNTSYSRTLSHYHSGPPEAGDQVAVLEVRKKRTPLPLPSKSIEVKERPLPKGASHGFIQPKGVVRQTLNGVNDVRQHVSPEVYGLLVYWNEKHGTVTHKLPELVNNCLINPTNTISKSAKVLGEILSGTFFLKIPSLSKYNKIFKPEDIRRAMDNHRTACTDLTVLPVNKDVISKTALIDFLYNERAVEAGMQYCSPMLYFFLKKPMDSKTYIPDIKMTEREQVCYDALLKHMEKTVKVDNAKHWTDFDLKCFRMAARHANRFSLDYDKVFMGDTIYTPGGAMLWYIKMAIKVNDDDFSPELLASRFTPMKVQKYLEKEGHWSESGFYVGLDYLADRPELCRMVGRMREKTVRRSFLVEYRFQNKIPKDHEERKLFNAQLDEYEAKRDVMIKEYESKDKPNGNMKRRMNRAA